MKINKKLICVSFICLAANYQTKANTTYDIPYSKTNMYFLEFGGGVSFPVKTQLQVNKNDWSSGPEGFNSTLNTAGLYMAGIGYKAKKWLVFDINDTYRGNYQYSLFQSPPGVSAPYQNRIRYFTLSSNSIMFNGNVGAEGLIDRLVYRINSGFIQPYIGSGIGVAFNTVSNFHTLLTDVQIAHATMLSQTTTSFAYQVNSGLELVYKQACIDLGYRYFNSGNFQSNNYLVSYISGTTGGPIAPIAISPWKGIFSANELYITAKIAIS